MCWCEVSKTIYTSMVCYAMEKLFIMLRREGGRERRGERELVSE